MLISAEKLNRETVSGMTFYRFADIERAGRAHYSSGEYLLGLLERFDTFGCFCGDEMVGYVLINPDHRYFGSSIYIREWKPAWENNNEECIIEMLRSVLKCYLSEGQNRYVTLDSEKKHDPNRSIYLKMGFADSLMVSSFGHSHTVMLAQLHDLLREPDGK